MSGNSSAAVSSLGGVFIVSPDWLCDSVNWHIGKLRKFVWTLNWLIDQLKWKVVFVIEPLPGCVRGGGVEGGDVEGGGGCGEGADGSDDVGGVTVLVVRGLDDFGECCLARGWKHGCEN